MKRNENNNVLYRFYNQLLHIKGAKSFISDINSLSFSIDNFSPETAKLTLKIYVNKYKENLNEIGKHLTGIVTLKRNNAYVEKTEDQLNFELHYVMRCIILFASVAVGLVPNLHEAVRLVKEDDLNLNSLNIYE